MILNNLKPHILKVLPTWNDEVSQCSRSELSPSDAIQELFLLDFTVLQGKKSAHSKTYRQDKDNLDRQTKFKCYWAENIVET